MAIERENEIVSTQQTAMITGATAGIGRATAIELAKNGYRLILTGRRKERLVTLKQELEKKYNIEVFELSFDISDRSQCEQTIDNSKVILGSLNILINNAGLARGVDPVDLGHLSDWEAMIDTNIKGLLYITRLCLPYLKQNLNSHIINIGSVAGHWVYPGGSVYSGTKHAVNAITQGLRMDLHGQGIRVTHISPGLVETEFSQVRLENNEKAKKVYEGMTPLRGEDIAKSIVWCLQQPKHVNIQDMVIFPTDQSSIGMVRRDPC